MPEEPICWREFEPGIELSDSTTGLVRFEQRPIGELYLPSGRLVVCDPFIVPFPAPLDLVMPGTFPVEIAIGHTTRGDQRIGAARVRFSESLPHSWFIVMPENVPQESINLKVRSTFTFGVDSGIAGFLSQESAAKLEGILDQDFMTVVAEQMHKTYEHTREWNNLKIPGVDELNALLFSSGYGDGSYVTYLGAGEQGQPVAVVVDCDVADGA